MHQSELIFHFGSYLGQILMDFVLFQLILGTGILCTTFQKAIFVGNIIFRHPHGPRCARITGTWFAQSLCFVEHF